MSEKKVIEYLKKMIFKITGHSVLEEMSIENYVDYIVDYFMTILHSMPNNVYWLDRNGLLRGGNHELARKLHLKSGFDLEGLTYEQMANAAQLPTKEFEPYRVTELEVMQSGVPSIAKEEPPIKVEGKTFYYLSNKTPLKNKKGEIIGVVGISTDITKLKEIQFDLKVALKKAEAANDAKIKFMMNMAHDLRTPLAGIIGIANIQAKEGTHEQDKQYGRWIMEAGNQLLELLNAVMDVMALEDREDARGQDRIELSHLMKELTELMQPSIIAKGLHSEWQFDPKLPAITSDVMKLKRILLNLISNAIKFTEKGTVRVAIHLLGINDKHARLNIQIKDTGIGIPSDQHEKIFDQFYRAHPSYRGVYTGYGVGLYLVKKAVDLLGGKITVSSEEGKGSCFTLAFNFPLAEEDAKEIGKSMDCISENATTKIKEVVLVVEDNDLVRHAIKIRLIHLGYDVMTVAEGKAALKALKTQPFSWVLLDIGLPDLSGTEVAQQYRQWERKNNKAYLPFFALTAHAGEKVEEKCYEAGIDYFLKKPLTEKDIKIIKQVIKKIKNDTESLINRK